MKTWIDKRDSEKSYIIKTIDKKFADIAEGSKMFIATPLIIDEYVKQIPFGKSIQLTTMRDNLAIKYKADKTCCNYRNFLTNCLRSIIYGIKTR